MRTRCAAVAIIAALLLPAAAGGAESGRPVTWDMAALSRPPRTFDAPGLESEGVRALFYEGLPWKGKPTRVFAWYGAPKLPAGTKAPAMVLIHGGGGTAFPEWVRLWNSRGYAAISMDTCGCTSGGEHGKRPRHEHGGPPGWGGWDQTAEPVQDQWMYHAVADAILATSLVASMPEVDAGRIGLTGISWGGILAAVVAGVDARPKFIAPVYGCGFLGDDSDFGRSRQPDDGRRARWLDLWDPSHYLPQARMPMLWVTGTNDFAFPLPAFQKSYRTPPGPRTLAVRVAMPHGQPQGAAPEEIAAFADQVLRGGPAPARITGQGTDSRIAWATFEAERPVVRAELCFTRVVGKWKDRKWETAPAELAAGESSAGGRKVQRGKVSATPPDDATARFFNLLDVDGRVVSTEHVAGE